MSNSVRSHRRQPTRLPRLWDSPGKGTGVGCHFLLQFPALSDQIRSVAQSCPTLCDPMNRDTPGLPVHHQLLEFTQTHVRQVSDAIQPSHSLSSLLLLPQIPPSIRVFSSESTLRMRFLPKNTQDRSPLEWTGWISLHSKGLSRVFSNTTVQKHQFFGAQPSSQSNSHIHT